MSVPEDRKYTESHEWIRKEADGTVKVGITDHAQAALGDLVYVEMPAAGRAFAAGDPCAVVESVKAASDVYAPLTGTIVAGNDALTGSPELVNQDAYGAWLFQMRPTGDAAQFDRLLDAAAYSKLIAEA
jgi:glycine cleavage system H protein